MPELPIDKRPGPGPRSSAPLDLYTAEQSHTSCKNSNLALGLVRCCDVGSGLPASRRTASQDHKQAFSPFEG